MAQEETGAHQETGDEPDAPRQPVPAALPPGLEPLAEFGPGVIGTRTRVSAIRWRWASAAAVAVIAVIALLSGAPLFSASVPDMVTLAVLVVVLGAVIGHQARAAAHGRRPVLTIDAETLRLLAPFNRVEVRLEAITAVTQLRRDLLIEAPGGVRRGGRVARSRWVPIDNAKSFEVDRAALAQFLRERAGLTGR